MNRVPIKADIAYNDGSVKIHFFIEGEEYAFIFSYDELLRLKHERGASISRFTF